jgi:hypothetical protein
MEMVLFLQAINSIACAATLIESILLFVLQLWSIQRVIARIVEESLFDAAHLSPTSSEQLLVMLALMMVMLLLVLLLLMLLLLLLLMLLLLLWMMP